MGSDPDSLIKESYRLMERAGIQTRAGRVQVAQSRTLIVESHRIMTSPRPGPYAARALTPPTYPI